jgi:UDP-N-acetylmuramate--alanine ligase
VADLVPEVDRTVVTYGFDKQADVRATDLSQDGQRMSFRLWLPDAEEGIPVSLVQPGRHNVLNALGAAAVAWELGVEPDGIVKGLAAFRGIGRRFARIGELPIEGGRVLAFEDYGHHPTELDAVLRAARAGWPDRRLVLVFQPHRYTRTRDQFDAFARVLAEADALMLLDLYPAGETPIAGIDSDALAREVRARRDLALERVAGIGEVADRLDVLCRDGDLLLVMGAGDVGQLAAQLRTSVQAVQA